MFINDVVWKMETKEEKAVVYMGEGMEERRSLFFFSY